MGRKSEKRVVSREGKKRRGMMWELHECMQKEANQEKNAQRNANGR
jgi:hypothetical protein